MVDMLGQELVEGNLVLALYANPYGYTPSLHIVQWDKSNSKLGLALVNRNILGTTYANDTGEFIMTAKYMLLVGNLEDYMDYIMPVPLYMTQLHSDSFIDIFRRKLTTFDLVLIIGKSSRKLTVELGFMVSNNQIFLGDTSCSIIETKEYSKYTIIKIDNLTDMYTKTQLRLFNRYKERFSY